MAKPKSQTEFEIVTKDDIPKAQNGTNKLELPDGFVEAISGLKPDQRIRINFKGTLPAIENALARAGLKRSKKKKGGKRTAGDYRFVCRGYMKDGKEIDPEHKFVQKV